MIVGPAPWDSKIRKAFPLLDSAVLMPPIREDYQNYRPPAWVSRIVKQLLHSLADQHVAGLSAIVLTESALIRKGRSRRVAGKKYAMKECLGFYRRRWQGEPPAIFLIVDNIVGGKPPLCWRLPFSRDIFLGEVLFHEVGHHLNATVGSLAGGEEASAEEWERRLWRIHFRTKYWYLRPVIRPLRFVAGWLLKILRSRAQRRASLRSHRSAY
jgi:hypothetical protein